LASQDYYLLVEQRLATVRRWAVPRFLVVQVREMPRDQRRGAAVVNYCYHKVEEPVAADQEEVGRSWFLVAAEQEVGLPRLQAVVVNPSCQLVAVVPMYYCQHPLCPLDSNLPVSLAVVLDAANLPQWPTQEHFRLSFCLDCGRAKLSQPK